MGNAEHPAASGFTFARRLGLLYAALFFVVGCYLPFMPVWLDWRELDAGEIAVLLAAPLFTRIVFTPLIGFAADLAGSRRNIVIALAWGSLAFVPLALGRERVLADACSRASFSPSTGRRSCR